MNNEVSLVNPIKGQLHSILKGVKAKFGFKIALGVASAIPIALTNVAAEAAQVQLNPPSPKLGDTISVIVTPDNPSNGRNLKVTSNGKTYPVFPIAPNQYRAFIPTTPLQKSGRKVIRVSGDGTTRNLAVWLKWRRFPTQRITLRGGKGGLKATQLELDRVKAFKALVTPTKYWNGAFRRPNNSRISTIYGVRRYYNGKFANNYYHRGVDYAGGYGSPIVAPAAGRVALVGRESQGFKVHGNVVGIDHGQGVTSIFMHLNRINVKEGDMVKPGQLIGGIGSTGASTGPHLHWGVYVNGQAVDPVPWRFSAIK
ncbi:metalloendopeptidase-like membrane protein [Rivularia sp. PCC 7116]|uniref:M23 family metallopeptidase n=1 Tax=Rivularia sp. PCC 7116 TaxID=373994 RepID=UPI00029EFEBB|nr:M23 family metallopeptidase [Rivularia sp. PCC 7116]AFY56980.1 metalloendopeptidase-like membrane protein [Rivularia sp. PCC 7116]